MAFTKPLKRAWTEDSANPCGDTIKVTSRYLFPQISMKPFCTPVMWQRDWWWKDGNKYKI